MEKTNLGLDFIMAHGILISSIMEDALKKETLSILIGTGYAYMVVLLIGQETVA